MKDCLKDVNLTKYTVSIKTEQLVTRTYICSILTNLIFYCALSHFRLKFCPVLHSSTLRLRNSCSFNEMTWDQFANASTKTSSSCLNTTWWTIVCCWSLRRIRSMTFWRNRGHQLDRESRLSRVQTTILPSNNFSNANQVVFLRSKKKMRMMTARFREKVKIFLKVMTQDWSNSSLGNGFRLRLWRLGRWSSDNCRERGWPQNLSTPGSEARLDLLAVSRLRELMDDYLAY